jgi:hypothetical protein
MSKSIADLARRLARDAEAVCRHYLSNGRRCGRFLVDDLNPIEAGRLPDGLPDLYFRGFYCWNSEVGAKTLGTPAIVRASLSG